MAGVMVRLRVAAAAPVARAALTSATVMAAGDALCQSIANHRQSKAVDWHRTARFSVIGLTLHGPLFYHGFRALDTHIGSAPTLRLVRAHLLQELLKKQPFSSAFITPCYATAVAAQLRTHGSSRNAY